MELQPLRPPYITFSREPIERRDADGNSMWVDHNFAHITQPGSADTVDKLADEWIAYISRLAQLDPPGYPPEWVPKIKAKYEMWKAGQTGPVDGTDIRNWPTASPAEIKNLTKVGVLAVEDLAVANEELLAKIGMGARALKQKAILYLDAQRDLAPVVAQLTAKDAEINLLKVRQATLEAQIAELTQMMRQQTGSAPSSAPTKLVDLETRLAEAQSRVPAVEADVINDVLNEELS